MTEADGPAELLDGRYRLGAYLGGGGMADVYRATDLRLDREVAVKVFRSGADKYGRQRFEDEARLLASLSHPGLVPLHEAKASDGELYLVMRLIEGEPLSDMIDRGPLPVDRVVDLGYQLAKVLAYVHDNGIVHRDVKPSNVLLDSDEQVFLTDFGISRLSNAMGRLTAEGIVMGTTSYLAPEQVSGGDTSYAADVYALGLVLLECVTGQVEYPGTASEAVLARLSRPPRIPDGLCAPLRDGLRAMTIADPRQRPTAARCARMLQGPSPSLTSQVTEPIRVSTSVQTSPPAEPTTISSDDSKQAEQEQTPASTGVARKRWKRLRGASVLIPMLTALGGGAALLLVLGLSTNSKPTDDAPPRLPAVQEPPGPDRLTADLANLEKAVRD